MKDLCTEINPVSELNSWEYSKSFDTQPEVDNPSLYE